MNKSAKWETIIGLEIHAQLLTKSKIFSGASTNFGAEPNTQACAIDLGLPGVLPVINEQAILMAIKFGLAINAEIPQKSVFARKNYFYPDLPKGYQISQFELPIVNSGCIEIKINDNENKIIRITRAHLEEDAGKSNHDEFKGKTGIDLNRAGNPLLEIVSEPDMNNAKEAISYLKKIHSLVRYLKICDGNMQEGSFRCDANISIKERNQKELGTRTEIKNLNSFKFIETAINYEVERQINLVESGELVIQETRLYDADKNETRSMRSKEEANDYRYFPDPDLLPILISNEIKTKVEESIPELPDAKRNRYQNELGLSEYDSNNLTTNPDIANYFEEMVRITGGDAKLCANWIMGDLSASLNKKNIGIKNSPVSAKMLGDMINLIKDKIISGKIAKIVFTAMWNGEGDAISIIKNKDLKQVTDSNEIEKLINDIISENVAQVEQYKNSSPEKKKKMISFFVGQIMKKSKGKANPKQVNELLEEKLED